MPKKLLVAPCDAKAATYAVEHWHYSQRMPVGRLVHFGAWEDKDFIGCVIFGRGANNSIGDFLGLGPDQCCELVRVATRKHECNTGKIVSISLRLLKKTNPNIVAVVSYADPEHGHCGILYQATNWIYIGKSSKTTQYFHNGRWVHNREITSGGFGRSGSYTKEQIQKMPKRESLAKLKYVYPLDISIRPTLERLAKPYPKKLDDAGARMYKGQRVGGADSGTPSHHEGGGGANPTPTLLSDP
jgi:hypothetical protein